LRQHRPRKNTRGLDSFHSPLRKALNVIDRNANLVNGKKYKLKTVTKLYIQGILVTVASAIALFVSLDFMYSWSQELYTVNIDRVFFMLPMLFILLKISSFYLAKIKKLEEA